MQVCYNDEIDRFMRMVIRDEFIYGGFEGGLQGTCSQVPPAHIAHDTIFMIIRFPSNSFLTMWRISSIISRRCAP
jgi:hypothetical protein